MYTRIKWDRISNGEGAEERKCEGGNVKAKKAKEKWKENQVKGKNICTYIEREP